MIKLTNTPALDRHVCSCSCSCAYGDADVDFRQRGGVVYAISGHAATRPSALYFLTIPPFFCGKFGLNLVDAEFAGDSASSRSAGQHDDAQAAWGCRHATPHPGLARSLRRVEHGYLRRFLHRRFCRQAGAQSLVGRGRGSRPFTMKTPPSQRSLTFQLLEAS